MSITLNSSSPYVSLEKFADDSGQTLRAVREDVKLGRIPTIQYKRGGKQLINVVAVYHEAQELIESKNPWDNQPHAPQA